MATTDETVKRKKKKRRTLKRPRWDARLKASEPSHSWHLLHLDQKGQSLLCQV